MDTNSWADRLGARMVRTDEATIRRYTANVSGLERVITAVLYPESSADVQALVRIANEVRLPLYPISTGCNWGLGSKLPVRDGAALVDLSRMDRIHEVNETHGYAVIEPGVTQRKLHERLQDAHSSYWLSVTGSGAETSILGNALDRGIAHHGPRAEQISGLEVVLGTSELIRTGSGHFPQSQTTYLYRHGIGPSLDGLFCQSNFGIVTRAAIRLMRRQPAQGVLGCAIAGEEELAALVDGVAALIRQGILDPCVHVSNRARARSVVGGMLAQRHADQEVRNILDAELRGAWSLSCPLSGTVAQVRLSFREARAALRKFGRVSLTTDRSFQVRRAWYRLLSFVPRFRRRAALLEAVEAFYHHSKGVPSDAALASIPWCLAASASGYTPGADLDATRCGTLFVLPILPLEGRAVREAMAMAHQATGKHGFIPYVTLNSASPESLEAVINIVFPRNDGSQVEKAHRCVDELVASYMQKGFILYRAGIQSMSSIVNADSPYWQLIARLKDVFDPNRIIAPGRYNLV
ncbi:MAG TPA: FAD-binding oxidoreductase [Gemmataceae bacterium]|nr:FAD-binding oxidoreductase [Gemmataceae bacterium]